jgi:glucose/galactose 1-dehydrogenase (NADP+)/aldose 1-dehydrogenase [NAD(P)+]
MPSIKAIVTNAPDGGVSVKTINTDISRYKVLLSPIYTGVCGTDRGIVSSSLKFAYNPEGSDYLVLGHESICEVIDSKVQEFKAGDLVVPVVRRPGDCVNCKIGRQDNCSDGKKHEAGITGMHGFMQEIFTEDPEFLVKVEDKTLKEVGVLTEPLKNVLKAFEVFETVSKRAVFHSEDSTVLDKNVVVIGTGCEAFLYTMMARDLGFRSMMVNRHPLSNKIEKIFDDLGLNFVNYAEDPDRPFSSGIDLLIDTSGDPTTVFNFLRKVNYNGVVILFGTNGRAPDGTFTGADIDYIVERNITIAGSVDAAKKHYLQAIEYLTKWHCIYGEKLENVITAKFPPENTAIFASKQKDELKSVIQWK